MKSHPNVTSSRRKCRRAFFNAPSSVRYRLMAATLSKELREKHGIRSLPVRKDDEVEVVRGSYKSTVGKVSQVYRKRRCLYLEKLTKSKKNGYLVRIPIQASNVVLTKLKLTRDREELIARKREGRGADKGKYTQQDVNK